MASKMDISHVIMNRSNVMRFLEEFKLEMTNSFEYICETQTLKPASLFKTRLLKTRLLKTRLLKTRLLKTLKNCMESSVRLSDFSEYLKFWIKKLSSCDCEDPYLTAVVINLYNACEVKRCDLTSLRDEISVQLLSDKGLTDVREGIDYRLMNVGRVIQREDWIFMKVLILYGIIRRKETLTQCAYETYGIILCSFLHDIVLPTERNYHGSRMKDIIRILDGIAFDSEGKEKNLRKFNVLKSLACKDHVWGRNPSEILLKCINYYFQVIPDPFVTAWEIEEVVEIPKLSQSILDTNLLRRFVILYSRLFPESGVLQPRSLQHLSRCAAREHICKYGLLPNVVNRLMIPKTTKDYLLVVNPES